MLLDFEGGLDGSSRENGWRIEEATHLQTVTLGRGR